MEESPSQYREGEGLGAWGSVKLRLLPSFQRTYGTRAIPLDRVGPHGASPRSSLERGKKARFNWPPCPQAFSLSILWRGLFHMVVLWPYYKLGLLLSYIENYRTMLLITHMNCTTFPMEDDSSVKVDVKRLLAPSPSTGWVPMAQVPPQHTEQIGRAACRDRV